MASTIICGVASGTAAKNVESGCVQLVAEGKEAEARQLLAYYDSVGLPHSWKQMNLEFTDASRRTCSLS